MPTSWQEDLADRTHALREAQRVEDERRARRRRRRRTWSVVLAGALLALAVAVGPDLVRRTSTEERPASTATATATTAEYERAPAPGELPGHIPGGTGVDVCALLTVGEVATALHDEVTSEAPGRRDGPTDPFGHCLWGLGRLTNLDVAVFTDIGAHLDGKPDFALATSWFGPARHEEPGVEWLDGVGDEAYWDADGEEVIVRVGSAALLVSVPMSDGAAVRTGLAELATIAAKRLVTELQKPPLLVEPAPGGEADSGSTIVYDLLEVGGCLDQFEPHAGGGVAVTTGDCDEPHAAEVAAVVDIADRFPEGYYPDPAEQHEVIITVCPTRLGIYAGLIPPDDPPRTDEELRAALRPLQEAGVVLDGAVASDGAWAKGRRVVVCVIASGQDGAPLERTFRRGAVSA